MHPPDIKQAAQRLYDRGMQVADIAAAIGVPGGTVYSWVRNASVLAEESDRRVANRSQAQMRTHWRAAKAQGRYGMRLREYEITVMAPCPLCGDKSQRLVLDHDHRTGLLRGAICRRCNSGIGLFRDRSGVLRKAADYIEASIP